MSKTPSTRKAKALTAPPAPTHTPEDRGRMALTPSVNGAAVIEAYQSNLMGKGADINAMIDGLRETSKEVKGGDLQQMEAMLIGQATALQTIFSSLARRASSQEHLRQYETFLGLALKAQAQSRATISALVDLKYPRQATFVKQANISNGHQQVNNGSNPEQYAQSHAGAGDFQTAPNKLLEVNHGQPGIGMDTRAAQTASRANQAVGTVGEVHRAEVARG